MKFFINNFLIEIEREDQETQRYWNCRLKYIINNIKSVSDENLDKLISDSFIHCNTEIYGALYPNRTLTVSKPLELDEKDMKIVENRFETNKLYKGNLLDANISIMIEEAGIDMESNTLLITDNRDLKMKYNVKKMISPIKYNGSNDEFLEKIINLDVYDTIVICLVLYSIENLKIFLPLIAKHLSKNGKLVIIDYDLSENKRVREMIINYNQFAIF